MESKRKPLKVVVLSDLHTEFTHFKCKFLDFKWDADVLVLAGDISCGMGARHWLWRINKTRKQKGMQPIIILMISGNHEFYSNQNIDKIRYKWKQISESKEIEGFIYLDNSCVQIQDVLFIGSTLWTDLKEDCNYIESKMNDFRKLNIGIRTYKFNTMNWLKKPFQKWSRKVQPQKFASLHIIYPHFKV
jgi:predicted MPP superfamily phosphohydrolase